MKITFTRLGERTYSTVAVRDDKVIVQVPGFDRPAWLPHDLAHYIVEHGLGLNQGFWGRVAAGAIFPGMKVLEGRQPPHAASNSKEVQREAPRIGTEAEVLVAFFAEIAQQQLERDWPLVQKRLRQVWQAGQTGNNLLGHSEVSQVCRELRDYQQQWQDLAIGQSLTVIWLYSKTRRR
jgi:hypothetical protein